MKKVKLTLTQSSCRSGAELDYGDVRAAGRSLKMAAQRAAIFSAVQFYAASRFLRRNSSVMHHRPARPTTA